MSNEDTRPATLEMSSDPGPRPTLYDVAEEAHVSIATVSRVVNGAANVRTHTRTRVERAVSKLGYVPNPQAQALRRCAPTHSRGSQT